MPGSGLRFPPRDPLFDSAWLKWGQAVVHSQALEADIDAFDDGADPSRKLEVRAEYQPKRRGFAIYLASIDPVPVRWGLMLSDVANNSRSCLDHIAWAVVTRGQTPPELLQQKARRRIGFPIADRRETFNGNLPTRLPGARRADLAKVRRYQSFHRGIAKRHLHVFSMLSTINNENKHRTIKPIWSVPMAAEYQVRNQRNCDVPTQLGQAIRKPLQTGMEIGYIRARKRGADPAIDVEARISFGPFLEHLVMVKQWLYVTRGWIFLLLSEFSDPPDELLEIGIDFGRLQLDPADMPRPPA